MQQTQVPASTVRREHHIPGEAGLWLLLFGDMTVFAVLFCVYLNQRGKQLEVFAHSQGTLNRDLGALNTLLLLSSSLLVVLATRAVRGAARRSAPRLLVGAIAFGLGFVAVKVVEYHDKIAMGMTPDVNKFYMYYFVLTGLHLAHLFFGLVVLVVLFTLSRKAELSEGQFVLFEGGACFWHMVDLLWIVIFPLLYLVR
ncbi:cytochrome c oxidase subunit 3 [Frankia sp. CiP1_Cm_nod1]|uniref:cytochrome c oxidase subunit 3 n=1 Tax=Frankia sp. CiP1_Cm_nod1 TaxID=2897160 RepID=UPI002025960D